MSTIILFDLPSKGRCSCWSPNPWKTRLALNYKELEYETQWIEYPDIEPSMKSFGIPPNESGTPYTIPALRLTGSEYIMDSAKIASALEKAYPEHSLHLESPILNEVQAFFPKIVMPFARVIFPKVPTMLLTEASVPYFERTREKMFNKPLAEVAKEVDEDKCFADVKPAIQELASLLKKDNSGPFFMGATVSYSDFHVVALLHWMKKLGLYEKFVEVDEALDALYKACAKWLERDD